MPTPAKDDSMTATSGLRSPQLASPDLLRSVFRRHAAGVAVITAQNAAGPVGFTATSLSSVSAEPPLLSFGIGTGASSWPVISEARHVGVHILGEHQRELAATFARSGADRFGAPTGWRSGPRGFPSSTTYSPGWSAGWWRVCRRVTTGSFSPRWSWATPRARGSRCCTTRAASTVCETDSRPITQGCLPHSSKRLLSGHGMRERRCRTGE